MLIGPWMLSEKDVCVPVSLEKDLKAADLERQGVAFPVEVGSVPEVVMKGLGREIDDVGVGNQVRPQSGVEHVRRRFGDVAEIRNQAGAAEEAWEEVPMDPLGPFRVAGRIRLLVLGLEDAYDSAVGVARKVAARATLGDHLGMNGHLNGDTYALDDILKLLLRGPTPG